MDPVIITDSIRLFSRGQWDVMAGNNVFASYGWLLAVEECRLPEISPVYFALNDNGKILAAAVCYVIPRHARMYSPDEFLFGRLKKTANLFKISFLPMMVCCPMKAYGKHIFLNNTLDALKKESIIEKLLNAMETYARNRKISLGFPKILAQEKELIKQLSQRMFLKTLDLPLAYMNILWSSFDDYKKHMGVASLNIKKSIAREMNKNRKAGVSIEKVVNLNGQEKCIYDLMNQNSLKYNKIPLPFHEKFLTRLKESFGDDLVIYKSVKREQISGAVVMLKMGQEWYLPFVGIDHSIAQNDFTYFNITFYRPIADAIDENIKRLYYGNAAYNLKIRRGCNLKQAYFFHKSFHPLSKWAARLWFPVHRYWYGKKFSQPRIQSETLI